MSSAKDEASGTSVVMPRSLVETGHGFPILSKQNYSLWAMRMQVLLEQNGLWEAIEAESVTKKKDHQALLVIYGKISDEILAQLDSKLTAKETWLMLKTKNLGVARVQNARVQALKCEFELLIMGEDELVSDFAGKLSKVVTQLRTMGEKLEGDVVAKLLQATPTKFDSIISSIE
ncbi:uncharacterized protein LOC144715516 [Wolffia australiana]